MTNSSDPETAIRALLAAATELADAQGVTATTETPSSAAATHPEVTERVTETITSSTVDAAVEDDQSATAEPVEPHPPRQLPKAVKPTEVVDPDTVRLERASDYEWTRTWLALAGTGDGARFVGYLRPTGKKWQALSPNLTAVGGSACQTKKAALLRLLDPHVPRS